MPHVPGSSTTRTRLASALNPLCRSRTAAASLLRSEAPELQELMVSCTKVSLATAATTVDTTHAIVPANRLQPRLEPRYCSTDMHLPMAPPTLAPRRFCLTHSRPYLCSETVICSGTSDPVPTFSGQSRTADPKTPTLSETSRISAKSGSIQIQSPTYSLCHKSARYAASRWTQSTSLP